MIYTKDGLTKARFIELLQYSLGQECRFLSKIKPNTEIINDHKFQLASVLKFLKIEEKIFEEIAAKGEKTISYRFSVKVLVEDRYWKESEDKEDEYYLSEAVPIEIHTEVNRILSGQ